MKVRVKEAGSVLIVRGGRDDRVDLSDPAALRVKHDLSASGHADSVLRELLCVASARERS